MSISALITSIFIFSRLSGFIIFMPVIGIRSIPNMIKIILMVCLTVVILPVVPPVTYVPRMGILAIGIVVEFFFGTIMSWVVNLVFAGLITGTEVISTQIGQAAAKQFNPSMSISQSPIGGIAVLLTFTTFLGVNMHLDMLVVLADSFVEVPPGAIENPIQASSVWIGYSGIVLDAGIRLAGPILALVFLNNSFLAVLTRLAPNMNVFFSVGFLVSMIGGLFLFMVLFPDFMEYTLSLAQDAMVLMRDMIEIAGGK